MSACPDRERLQDLLDGLVAESEADPMRRHIAGCAACAAEWAGFERLFDSLARRPLETPSPELMSRVLSRVLPSRVRRRRLAWIGWGYAASVASFAVAVMAIGAHPPARAWVEQSAGALSHDLVELMRLGLHLAGVATLSIASGLDVLAVTGARLEPIARALQVVLTRPTFAAPLLGALVACAALMWWLRPLSVRRRPTGPTDVGILGLGGLS